MLAVPQDAFALRAGVDRSYYGKLERGERQPTLSIVLRIASALGVSAHVLIADLEARLSKKRKATLHGAQESQDQ